MATLAKVAGVAVASIGKVTGVAKASIGKVAGVDMPASFANSRSLSFDGSNDRATRTFGAGNRRIWTYSAWFQQSAKDADRELIDCNTSEVLRINSANKILIRFANLYDCVSNEAVTDTTTWHHIVWAVDSTQATAANRNRAYLDGTELTWATSAYAPQNTDSTAFNTASPDHYIGSTSTTAFFPGLMDECSLIDGQQLVPSDFASSNLPIDLSGLTFGTNGFWLRFENTSALGEDSAGANDWTVSGATTSTTVPA